MNSRIIYTASERLMDMLQPYALDATHPRPDIAHAFVHVRSGRLLRVIYRDLPEDIQLLLTVDEPQYGD